MMSRQFFRFCCIGTIGFVVDSGVTSFGIILGLSPFVARIPAILTALTICYVLHLRFTFKSTAPYSLSGWMKFFMTNMVGSVVNYTVYCGMLFLIPALKVLYALAIASIVALAVNYLLSRRFVFTK